MSMITTHILDTTAGKPAAGVAVVLERCDPGPTWTIADQGKSDVRGRIKSLSAGDRAHCMPGLYRLRFDTSQLAPFFPEIVVQFVISGADQNYHIPLLLSPFGYTTYRGS